jgi:hypothetical protein
VIIVHFPRLCQLFEYHQQISWIKTYFKEKISYFHEYFEICRLKPILFIKSFSVNEESRHWFGWAIHSRKLQSRSRQEIMFAEEHVLKLHLVLWIFMKWNMIGLSITFHITFCSIVTHSRSRTFLWSGNHISSWFGVQWNQNHLCIIIFKINKKIITDVFRSLDLMADRYWR